LFNRRKTAKVNILEKGWRKKERAVSGEEEKKTHCSKKTRH